MYYNMGEVCEMFDLPASTLRFWEKEFKALKPRRNSKGNRLFTPSDIETLKLIYHLVKERNMTLKGAQESLAHRKAEAASEFTMVEILQRIRSTLVEVRQELESLEVEQKSYSTVLNANDKPQKVRIYSEHIDDLDDDEVLNEEDSPFTQLTLF